MEKRKGFKKHQGIGTHLKWISMLTSRQIIFLNPEIKEYGNEYVHRSQFKKKRKLSILEDKICRYKNINLGSEDVWL